MVRQLHTEMDDEVFENTHPGCIWGIFHALHYNYWEKNVKRLLPHRNHHVPKYSKGTGRQRTLLTAYDSDEAEKSLDIKTSRVAAGSTMRKTSLTKKRSLGTRIKSLISEEPSKKKTYKRRGSGSPTQPKFQRTCSIHHLECSDYVVHRRTQRDGEVNKLKNQGYYQKFNKSGTGHVSEKYEAEPETSADVLEIYRVNKDLFANVLKYTDGAVGESFCNFETREARAKLTRSGSYPLPKLSQVKNFKSSKLDHKKNEIWSHLKIDKLLANTQPQVVDGTTKNSRRTLSLNESSFEKYAQLLPKSSIGEPKFSSSKSLRLTSEHSFNRAWSLSRIDFNGVFQNEPSGDSRSAVLAVSSNLASDRNVENDSRLNKDVEKSDNNVKVEDLSNLIVRIDEQDTAEVPKINEEIEEPIKVPKDSKKDEEIYFVEVHEENPTYSNSFLKEQSDLEEDETLSLSDFLACEDVKCENSTHDKESPVDSQPECCSKSLSRCSTTSNKRFQDIVDEIELQIRNYDDFDYVSDILDRSGFSRNNLLAPWYSLDQLLNPSVFDEVEACWPHEDSCPKDEFCCHHQLLFDLINEVLVQIYNTSFTYHPRALSSNCRVPPVPAKFNVLDEVWGRVSNIMNSKPGSDQTVDGIVAEDIWSDDCWMNLQLESECVALELEDMFFEELLDEIVGS